MNTPFLCSKKFPGFLKNRFYHNRVLIFTKKSCRIFYDLPTV
ncbi:hypothetical protein BE22_0078 [Staphylococcus phage vB_SepS_BE22]|nr:hypothetical protein BE22_0078 [Staphylococcus phage vB_SepS_BE22]